MPTVADIEHIAANDDPVVRNLQITQCYYALSQVLAPLTGHSANWCTFATWASKQAGQTIRQEDLARALEYAMTHGPAPQAAATPGEPAAAQAEALVQRRLWELIDPRAPFKRASDAVARGNLKVFAEIGREFARFYATCFAGDRHDEATIAQFCAGLQPGDAPAGQSLLRLAFRTYYSAMFSVDDSERSQIMLRANLAIGLHEQTRLQPEITEAMEAPVLDPRELAGSLLDMLPDWELWGQIGGLLSPFGAKASVDRVVDHMVDTVRYEARAIISDRMMTLSLPNDIRLRLGSDLRADFPPQLQTITDPTLHDLLARIDFTPDSVKGTGASDWANFNQRIHFIADFFRCYQEWPPLFEPPFTAKQAPQIEAGRKPRGRL
ncbi:MAG: hypothetical protein IPK16_07220 [Anaerolineales bacterium]|nr:hypothetical protein [Anaerolineales bacterium]